MKQSKRAGLKLAGAYISDEKYNSLVALAKLNHRTLADQCRAIYEAALAETAASPGALAAPEIQTEGRAA